MNKARSVNRLFLILILISVASPFLLGRFFTDITFYQSVSISQTFFLVPVLIYLIFTRGEILEEMQLKVPKLSVLIMVVLFSNLLQPLMACLNLFSLLFVENYVAAGMMEVDGLAVGRNMMYIALVPALAEEFMFRGIFYHSYRQWGIWKAALCSGLCFGLVHMNLNQFLYVFVLGVIFALLVEATGSVISAILAHFTINAGSVSMLALQAELEMMLGSETALDVAGATETLSRQDIILALQVYAISAVICCLLAYVVFRVIVRWSGRKEHIEQVLHPGRVKRTSSLRREDEDGLMREDLPKMQKERILTPALILGIVGAATYMVITEFLL